MPYDGRVVPFITFTNDILFFIYGKTKYKDESSLGIIFKVALLGFNYAKSLEIINISNYKVKKELGLPTDDNYFSLDNLHKRLQTIINLGTSIEQKKQQKNNLTNFENQLYVVYQKVDQLLKIINGDFYLVYDKHKKIWHKMNELEALKNDAEYTNLYKGILALSISLSRKSHQKANEIIEKGIKTQLLYMNSYVDNKHTVELEYFYIKYGLLKKSFFLFFIALIFAVISAISEKRLILKVLTILFSFSGFLFEVMDIILRTIISSRAPVSSFYESLYYISSATFLFSFIYYVIFKNYKVLCTGIGLNTLTLMLLPYTGLNPHIKVLMPALRSPWLIYHVHTITLSYALFAIAFILSHWIILKYLIRKVLDNELVTIIYNMIKVGVVFLLVGIMLGSIWGAEAWGRYWGWDPKETWALITLLGYLAIIHMKKARTIEQFGIAIGAVVCFYLVGVTYYGASFIFVGLHSYAGDTVGNFLPLWLIISVLVEIIFVAYSIYAHHNMGKKVITHLSTIATK